MPVGHLSKTDKSTKVLTNQVRRRCLALANTNGLTAEDVTCGLAGLEFPVRLIVRLAVQAGMRPGKILGFKWPCVKKVYAIGEQRVYRGKVDTPKTVSSSRIVALSSSVMLDIDVWRDMVRHNSGWQLSSERMTTPL